MWLSMCVYACVCVCVCVCAYVYMCMRVCVYIVCVYISRTCTRACETCGTCEGSPHVHVKSVKATPTCNQWINENGWKWTENGQSGQTGRKRMEGFDLATNIDWCCRIFTGVIGFHAAVGSTSQHVVGISRVTNIDRRYRFFDGSCGFWLGFDPLGWESRDCFFERITIARWNYSSMMAFRQDLQKLNYINRQNKVYCLCQSSAN